MQDNKCAFSIPLISNDYGCRHATAVTRRGGPDIACADVNAARRCAAVFEGLKAVALERLGMEDDLLSMPHSTLVRIQYGGPAGLARLLGDSPVPVTDIDGLLGRAGERFGSAETIPVADVAEDMVSHSLRRRGRG